MPQLAGFAGRGRRSLVLGVIALSLWACAYSGGGPASDTGSLDGQPATAPPQRIDGTITYREYFALPPGSIVRVFLQDASNQAASLADAEVARHEILTAGEQVPIRFELEVDAGRIDPLRPYEIDAQIEVEGRVRFTLPFPVRVLTRGEPTTVDLELRSF